MNITKGIQDYIITKLVPIKDLSVKKQEALINSAEVSVYKPGARVFEEGSEDRFVHYLLHGKLEMISMNETAFLIDADSRQSYFPLSYVQPRKYSAHVIHPSHILKLDYALLESFNISDKSSLSEIDEPAESVFEDNDWMSYLLESKIFSNIPPQNIQKIFSLFEEVFVSKGDVIIEQGGVGNYYYVIKDGVYEVSRYLKKKNKKYRLARLKLGDGFGEDALLRNAPRNASVICIEDGNLMRITKESFLSLISDPAIKNVSYEQALKIIHKGANWVDVRFPDEHKQNTVEGSINIPLDTLRVQMKTLDPKMEYVVFCDDGSRSAVASFLLLNCGYSVSYLEGGMKNNFDSSTLENNSDKHQQNNNKDNFSINDNITAEYTCSGKIDSDSLVQALISNESDMDELSKSLSRVLASVFKQLEQALKEKAEAEIAREIAEQKLKITQTSVIKDKKNSYHNNSM